MLYGKFRLYILLNLYIFFLLLAPSLWKTSFGDTEIIDQLTLVSSEKSNKVPEILSLQGTNLQVAQVPLVSVLDNGVVTLIKQENYPEKAMSIVGYYNPVFKFQFREGSKLPLKGIEQILVGEIKQYDNSFQAINASYVFRDIKLGEDTVLELENDGYTFMVIEVQFTNNMSGIYATAFENTHSFGDSKDRSEEHTSELQSR